MRKIFIFIITISFFACGQSKSGIEDDKIKIEWVDNLLGDFSFKDDWSYPIGVYTNEFGQLSCDGFCPSEIDAMKDSTGQIYKDSLKVFYEIVDTTHLKHSIQCEAWWL